MALRVRVRAHQLRVRAGKHRPACRGVVQSVRQERAASALGLKERHAVVAAEQAVELVQRQLLIRRATAALRAYTAPRRQGQLGLAGSWGASERTGGCDASRRASARG
jgi:hypothetical protein